MSMTREEAIKFAEHAANMTDIPEVKEFYRLSAAALRPASREQVEKVWRGEWKPTEFSYMNECEDCSVCGYRTVWGHGFRFCPACGSPMTDEAVQMVMERLEKLHEDNGCS